MGVAGSTVSVLRGTQESIASLMMVSVSCSCTYFTVGQNEVFSLPMFFPTPPHTHLAFCLNNSSCATCVNFTTSNCSDSFPNQCESEIHESTHTLTHNMHLDVHMYIAVVLFDGILLLFFITEVERRCNRSTLTCSMSLYSGDSGHT